MKSRIFRVISLTMATLMLVFSFAACNKNDSSSKDGSSSKDDSKPTLKVATSADYPPYEFHYVDGKDDKIVGFEMDIARYLGEQMGYNVEIVDMDFNGILAAVDSGVVDCGIAAMSIDEERLKSVDFSNYYYIGKQSALVRAEDKDKYPTFESLKGKTVGVQNGTIHEKIANEKIPDVNIKALTSVPDMILELKSGKVDALVLDAYVAEGYAKKYDDIHEPSFDFGPPSELDSYAVAVKKGNTEIVEKLNKAIEALEKTDNVATWTAEANELMLKAQAE